MKKVSKRLFCAVLTVAMVASLGACGKKKVEVGGTTEKAPEYSATAFDGVLLSEIDGLDHDAASAKIYDKILGDFKKLYDEALEAENISARYALMAVAEAKLMESAVMLPTTTRGGNYAVTRVVPRTGDYVLWGNDSDRFHSIVVCDKILTAEDRAAVKALWFENRGTGKYTEKAKAYLQKKGYTFKDTYTMTYNSDPQIWDALATSRAADSEAIVNTFDGLYEYDNENVLQPALAESHTVSDDGLTYTFKLRKGAKWVDSQGREIGEVTADDFVAAMQHMLDAGGGLEYLVQGIIKGVNEYVEGTVTDFSKVGVKAVDNYTLEYTLEAPCAYFMTMLGYNIFAPLNRAYFESQGGKFGTAYDAGAPDYKYGQTKDNIAYCGPYLVSNATAENTIVFSANPSYWNPKAVNVKTITWLYNDGSDATKAYNDCMSGVIDGCGLNSEALKLAKNDGTFDKNAYVSDTDATSYMAFFNLNRAVFANINDDTAVVSPKNEAEQNRTKQAMLNNHFRAALSMSLDRASYNAQSVGEELKNNSLRNSYTPYNFVSLEEDVVIGINGKKTTFKKGTYYGEIMQAQIDADKFAIQVYNPQADGGNGAGDGYDGWFNPAGAVAELEKAIEQLKNQGIEISTSKPIYIDYPCYLASTTRAAMANVVKQSIEAALQGKVIVNIIDTQTTANWYYSGYYTDYGYEANYDIYDVSGWGPDYGDPQTYLDTFLPDFAGYMVKCIGIF
jgi:ABC-type oligopeptide transport system substrate-binding subunit